MKNTPELVSLSENAVSKFLIKPSTTVDIRRDIYLFIDFVQREGLKRAYRGNTIPKTAALKLAKFLSWSEERERVEQDGCGRWSDKISRIAHWLGLVSFDTEGVYVGYTSSEPSYPDNEIKVDKKKFSVWMNLTPLEKEQAILDKLILKTENEFFNAPSVIKKNCFDRRGCAVGPASRMPLSSIRRNLLKMLADLPEGVWFSTSAIIEHLQSTAPNLIIDPSLCRVPFTEYELRLKKQGKKVEEEFDERYKNFCEVERTDSYSQKTRQLSEKSPNIFQRVEGRYLQYFLSEIPFLCGFVDLAMALENSEKWGPPLEIIGAFRITPRLRQVVNADSSINQVNITVLPNFDIMVEAPSWPDKEFQVLNGFCERLKEDGPMHLMHLDRKKVLAYTASHPEEPSPREILAKLASRPLPTNVASELDAWGCHAQKLTVYENVALVELTDTADHALNANIIQAELGKLVLDNGMQNFIIARNPTNTIAVLEQRQRVPYLIKHGKSAFAECAGSLGRPIKKSPSKITEQKQKRKKVELTMEDLIGYRADDIAFLARLNKALKQVGCFCSLNKEERLLLVRAAELKAFRTTLDKLNELFEVKIERAN